MLAWKYNIATAAILHFAFADVIFADYMKAPYMSLFGTQTALRQSAGASLERVSSDLEMITALMSLYSIRLAWLLV